MMNCIAGTLAPYNGTWDRRQIQHLYNRLGNGANLEDISYALTKTPAEIVDELMDDAMIIPPMEDDAECLFPWAYAPESTVYPPVPDHRWKQLEAHFAGGLVINPVRYKLTLFWHGHFVTETHQVHHLNIQYLFLYYRLLHQHALGNFKNFTQEMGLDPYMLLYLNGSVNVAAQPNENYARELLELFTLGVDNYEQIDIENIARALTGWKVNVYTPPYSYYPGDTIFNADEHDWEEITLFDDYNYSPTGTDKVAATAEYEWVYDTIFEAKKEVLARHICRKLYKYYVYDEVNEEIVDGMAATFIGEGLPEEERWQIHTVLRELFKSEHFYHTAAFGAHIKSPLELIASFYKQTGLMHNVHWFMVHYGADENYNPAYPFHLPTTPSSNSTANTALVGIKSQAALLGQSLFLPPSVAGWPGGQTWINEFTMVNRADSLNKHLFIRAGFPYLDHAFVVDSVNQYLQQMVINISNLIGTAEPRAMTEAIIDHYMMVRPSEEHIGYAVSTLIGGIPTNYIDSGTWIYEEYAAPQLKQLLAYLIELPAFQLN